MSKLPQAAVKRLIAESGGECAFPGCSARIGDGYDGRLDVAHIKAASSGGTRYSADASEEELGSPGNLILLCPTHHRLVDADVEGYSVAVLERMRAEHTARVAAAIVGSGTPPGPSLLDEALDIWGRESGNSSEEFWQDFFNARPHLLETIVPGGAVQLRGRCYVGGKRIDNTGSNLLDFLAQGRGNATLIELKTPTSRLLGPQYRDNVWMPSRELAGATVQVLEYRSSLLRNLHALSREDPDVEAPDPVCVVLVGNISAEQLTPTQRRSFELYRQALRSVVVLTYDEFFGRLEATRQLLASNG
jgi:hypothetical protein